MLVGGTIKFITPFGKMITHDSVLHIFSSGENSLFGFARLSCFERIFSRLYCLTYLLAYCSLVLWYPLRQSLHALLDVQLAFSDGIWSDCSAIHNQFWFYRKFRFNCFYYAYAC